MNAALSISLGCLLCLAGTMAASAEEVPPTQTQAVSEVPASAGDAAGPAKDRKTADADKSDEVRCKRVVVTGSRLGKSVCHTEEEWAAMERAAKEAMRDYDANSRTQPRPELMGLGGG